jgi:hypothetical protein
LAQRFAFHDTLKKASWLNSAELELSARSRICLDRRISTIHDLDREIQALVMERNARVITVAWQFTVAHARDKLQRHYEHVKSKN